MAATYANAMLNAVADEMAAQTVSISLHSADPGASGASNELAGGRQVPAWGAAAAGVVDLSSTLSFTGMDVSTTVSHIGLWATGPTWLGTLTRTSGDAATNAAGEYDLTSAEQTAANV